jgi:hypothetical protein
MKKIKLSFFLNLKNTHVAGKVKDGITGNIRAG